MKSIPKKNDLKTISAKILAKTSLNLGKAAVNTACCFIYHQPQIPKTIKEMKKN
jgi:AgrD protein